MVVRNFYIFTKISSSSGSFGSFGWLKRGQVGNSDDDSVIYRLVFFSGSSFSPTIDGTYPRIGSIATLK